MTAADHITRTAIPGGTLKATRSDTESIADQFSAVYDPEEDELEIRDQEGRLRFEPWASIPDQRAEDCRRLVVVWNARAGLSTAALEAGALGELIQLVRAGRGGWLIARKALDKPEGR